MLKGLLIVTGIAVVLLAALVGVVAMGMRQIAARQAEQDQSWTGPTTAPATAPAALASSSPTPDVTASAIPASEVEPPEHVSIQLMANEAKLTGKVRVVESKSEYKERGRGKKAQKVVQQTTWFASGFTTPDDALSWSIDVPRIGEYEIDMNFACPKGGKPTPFVVTVGSTPLTAPADPTRNESAFRLVGVGRLLLPAGKTTVTIAPLSDCPGTAMRIRGVELIPTSE